MVSRSSTVTRRPPEDMTGACDCAGEITILLDGSSSCTFSSNVSVIREPLTLSSPGAGELLWNTGGVLVARTAFGTPHAGTGGKHGQSDEAEQQAHSIQSFHCLRVFLRKNHRNSTAATIRLTEKLSMIP